MTPETRTGVGDDAWDTGELGRDEKYVRVAKPESELALEETLGLQMISIRLQKELIEQLKLIAEYRRVGYQPLMRDVLCRWARSEMLVIANEMREQLKAREVLAPKKRRHA